MIGFELSATGSNGYRRKSGAWTEGSLIALKIAISLPGNVNAPGAGKPGRGMLDSIEASFSRIAKNLLRSICGMGATFTLFMKGDIKFKYVFDGSKGGDQVESEFLNLLGTASDGGVGDQVMIHICRTIQDFVTMNLNAMGEDLVLTIDIDL